MSDEQAIFPCGYCKVPILTWWASNNTGLLRGEYVLAGEVFFHPQCVDAAFEQWKGTRNGAH